MSRALNRLVAAVTCLVFGTGAAAEADVPYGVSFDDVLALGGRPPDQVESYGAEPTQRLEFWLHADGARRPLVVLIHGGCWLNAYGVEHLWPLASAVRDAGFVVVAPEYRRVGDPGGGWPGSLEDVEQAVLDVLERGDQLGFDAGSWAIAGHSAGGHLALLAEQRIRERSFGPDPARMVVGLAAITDPVAYAAGTGSCNEATPQFFGGMPDDVPSAYRLGSPVEARRRIPAPGRIVLLQGDADPIVPMEQAEVFHFDPPDVGNPGEVVILEGAAHFDLIHPGTPALPALLDVLDRFLGVSEGRR